MRGASAGAASVAMAVSSAPTRRVCCIEKGGKIEGSELTGVEGRRRRSVK